MDGLDTSKLNVSLEPHLMEALRPLPDLLPPALAGELKSYISEAAQGVIPYSTLLAISQWSRTPEGSEKLRENSLPLNSSSYMMVSLLAGVKTSPERVFGSYTPPPDPEQIAEQQKRERKEITAILNALLSVFGVGFATWWAADKLHWKNQWVQCLFPWNINSPTDCFAARAVGAGRFTRRCHRRKRAIHPLAVEPVNN
ncbi:hypothetical protein AN958_09856 [Leucoagaricus sp. SymC.cos]|nr:hypothetical protein AN958_09856 [Leucoagaricus sp. SymC.cos]